MSPLSTGCLLASTISPFEKSGSILSPFTLTAKSALLVMRFSTSASGVSSMSPNNTSPDPAEAVF